MNVILLVQLCDLLPPLVLILRLSLSITNLTGDILEIQNSFVFLQTSSIKRKQIRFQSSVQFTLVCRELAENISLP